MMSYSQSLSNCHDNNHIADDSSTVYDADTVVPDEVPSLPQPEPDPPSASLTAAATEAQTEDHHHQFINNESISPYHTNHESPATTISDLLRRIKSRHSPAMPSTITVTTAAAAAAAATTTKTASEEISINHNNRQSLSSSSSSKKKLLRHCQRSSRNQQELQKKSQTSTQPRRSTRLKKLQQLQEEEDQSCTHKYDSESENENDSEDEFDEDYKSFNEKAVINQSSSSQTSTTKGLTKYEARWRSKFNELRAFKQLHGHTSAPKSNKQIGLWVKRQRTEYKRFKKSNGRKGEITTERIQMLESINFQWVSQNKAPRNDSEWNKRFIELSEYKEKFGDTNVPYDFIDITKLGVWVSTQRTQYRKLKDNKHSCMTLERIQMLESIGFEWVSQIKGPRNRFMKWKKHFNNLLAYKKLHGHTNVSQKDKQLGVWVHNQRKQYKKMKANEKSQITPERVQMLNSIGFQWSLRNR